MNHSSVNWRITANSVNLSNSYVFKFEMSVMFITVFMTSYEGDYEVLLLWEIFQSAYKEAVQ